MFDVTYSSPDTTVLVDGLPAMKLSPGTARPIQQTLLDGATVNWSGDAGQVAVLTIAGNRTMAAPTDLVDGAFYTLDVIQDGVGGRTLVWNVAFKWANQSAPSLVGTPGARDSFSFKSDGTYLYEHGRSQGVA